jgi:hypothetical protein
VAAVAEGLVGGVTASAEGDPGAAAEAERLAVLVAQRDIPLETKRPVVPDRDPEV